MPLIKSKSMPSPEQMQALRAGLAKFVDPGDPLRGLLLYDSPGPHEVHRVYSLGMGDLANGKGTDSAKPVGWRFLAGNHKQAGACHVSAQLDKVTGVSSAPEIAYLLFDVIPLVEKLERVNSREYELQMLRIPGLHIEAFWLKADKSADDLAVQIPPKPEDLSKMQAVPMKGFLDGLRESAQKQLTYDDPQHGG